MVDVAVSKANKQKAVQLARAEGNKVAAKKYRVHPDTIRRWLRADEEARAGEVDPPADDAASAGSPDRADSTHESGGAEAPPAASSPAENASRAGANDAPPPEASTWNLGDHDPQPPTQPMPRDDQDDEDVREDLREQARARGITIGAGDTPDQADEDLKRQTSKSTSSAKTATDDKKKEKAPARTATSAEARAIVSSVVQIADNRLEPYGVQRLSDEEREALESAWTPVLRRWLSEHSDVAVAAWITIGLYGPRIMQARGEIKKRREEEEGGKAKPAPKPKPKPQGDVDLDRVHRQLRGGG